jgi:hypothetical protein
MTDLIQTAIIDGMLHGQVLREYPGGQFVVTITEPEPFDVIATWDDETRAASTGEPLMVTLEGE